MRRPVAVAIVALALGSLFVAIRLASFDGDATRFVVAAAGLVAGLVLWRRDRAWGAAAAFTLAVLARETTVLVPLAIALTVMVGKRRLPPVSAWLPLAVAGLWQLFLWWRWDTTGPGAAGDARPGLPGLGLSFGLRYQARTGDWAGLVLALALLAAVMLGAIVALRPGRAGAAERLAFAGAALVLLCASRFVWVYDSGFLRAGTEMWILTAVLLLGHRGGQTLLHDAGLAASGLSVAVAALHATGA